jgi:hypothetical protein
MEKLLKAVLIFALVISFICMIETCGEPPKLKNKIKSYDKTEKSYIKTKLKKNARLKKAHS